MQLQRQGVYVETTELTVWGTLTFPEVQRLSDALNAADRRFLALTDVTLATKATGERTELPFIALAAQHVILAVPVDAGDGAVVPRDLAALGLVAH
jgi:hypothetical protein